MINKPADTTGSKPNELQNTDPWIAEKQATYDDLKADLNAKILEVSMTIRKEYPELSKFIEEMTETIPDKKNPTVSLNSLTNHYESLCVMLTKYRQESPAK